MESAAGDVFVRVVVDASIKVLSFAREEVVIRLMDMMALAAKMYGPYSQEVEALEDDLDDVKAGGNLSDYTWLFPDFDEGVEENAG